MDSFPTGSRGRAEVNSFHISTARELFRLLSEAYAQAGDGTLALERERLRDYVRSRYVKAGDWERYVYEGEWSSLCTFWAKELYSKWVKINGQKYKIQATETYSKRGCHFEDSLESYDFMLRLRDGENKVIFEAAQASFLSSPDQVLFDAALSMIATKPSTLPPSHHP
ncbi:MAG: hypothetical protein HY466_01820 [Deltaproteobacteria bacterium]|nr:hypothetical protein [Deltaproteobacteria bacterium]